MKQSGHIRIKDNESLCPNCGQSPPITGKLDEIYNACDACNTKWIRIKEKVYFEPEGLEKPDVKRYWVKKKGEKSILNVEKFEADFKQYEASKQLIEVSNDYYIEDWRKNLYIIIGNSDEIVIRNNQPCEAEVKNNVAIITKIL